MSRAFCYIFYPIISHVPKFVPKLWFQTDPISCLSPKLSNDGSYMGVSHHDSILPIGSWNKMSYTKPQEFMFKIKRRQDFINPPAHDQACGINPSTGTPSAVDEDRLVLRASRRPTRALILASLGARIGVRDSSAMPSTHRADAFAVLSAPKRLYWFIMRFMLCLSSLRVRPRNSLSIGPS